MFSFITVCPYIVSRRFNAFKKMYAMNCVKTRKKIFVFATMRTTLINIHPYLRGDQFKRSAP